MNNQLNPASQWSSQVAKTMTQRNCSHGEATRLTAAAYPDFFTLVQAYGRTRSTVVFLNSQLAHGTPLQGKEDRHRLNQFVNANLEAGLPPAAALGKAYRDHPELVSEKQFVNIVMPGQIGRVGKGKMQFVNDDAPAGKGAPVGNEKIMALFFLPNTASADEFNAAWDANGGVASPIDYAKIFDGLTQFDMKQNGGTYDQAIARCKVQYAQLWDAVDVLAKMPV